MNCIQIVGKVVSEWKSGTSPNGVRVLTGRVMVRRPYSGQSSASKYDYLTIKIFGDQKSEMAQKWFKEGDMIGVSGHLEVDRKEGGPTYVTVVVSQVYFVGGGQNGGGQETSKQPQKQEKKADDLWSSDGTDPFED